MYCSGCGRELNGAEQFCGHCGKQVNVNGLSLQPALPQDDLLRAKRYKVLILAIAIVLACATVVACAFAVGNMRQHATSSGQVVNDSGKNAALPQLDSRNDHGRDADPDPDISHDLTELMKIKINGVDYTLPTTIDAFVDNGWVVGTSSSDIDAAVKAESYEIPRLYFDSQYDIAIGPVVVNTSEDEDSSVRECPVMGMCFTFPSESPDFELSNGFSYGTSYVDFKRYFGEPADVEEAESTNGDSILTATWEFEIDDSRVTYTGQFSEDDGSGLSMFSMIYEPDGLKIW